MDFKQLRISLVVFWIKGTWWRGLPWLIYLFLLCLNLTHAPSFILSKKIKRRAVETMSNIPWNLDNFTLQKSFYVNIMSTVCQFYVNFMPKDPNDFAPPPFWTMVKSWRGLPVPTISKKSLLGPDLAVSIVFFSSEFEIHVYRCFPSARSAGSSFLPSRHQWYIQTAAQRKNCKNTKKRDKDNNIAIAHLC